MLAIGCLPSSSQGTQPAADGSWRSLAVVAEASRLRRRSMGARIEMVLDTGASAVVLTQEAARAAGLPLEVLRLSVQVDTANGRTRAAPVTLDRVSIGGITERAVPALIAQAGQLRVSLLGMSSYRLERWESAATGSRCGVTRNRARRKIFFSSPSVIRPWRDNSWADHVRIRGSSARSR